MTTLASRLGLFIASLTSTVAIGQINVDYLSGSNWINITQLAAGSNVTINDTTGLTYRVYTLTPTTQSIGNVTMNSTGTNAPTLFVGTGRDTTHEDFPVPNPGALNIGSIQYSGGQPKLQVNVNGDISSDVSFWHIVRFDVGGAILGNVIHEPIGATPPPRLGYITANTIGSLSVSPKVIAAKYGDIHTIIGRETIFSNIDCLNGSITNRIESGTFPTVNGHIASASIQAPNGSINDIISNRYFYTNGANGAETNVQIQAKSGIHIVRSYHRMRADITANANGGTGDIARVEILSGDINSDPSFYGTITANKGTGEVGGWTPINCEADFFGRLDLKSDLERGVFIAQSFGVNSVISVGGSIASGAAIDIGSSSANPCVDGQIIVNANNNNSFWSTSSSATLCGVSLSNIPWYTNLPSTFGGGSIGEAPFNYHALNCSPPHNAAVPFSNFPATVVVRHYGPVFSLGNGCMRHYARPTGTLTWTEYTADFTYTVTSNNNRRNVEIKKFSGIGWTAGYDYRIVPVTDLNDCNAPRCLDVVNKPAVRNYEYLFSITN